MSIRTGGSRVCGPKLLVGMNITLSGPAPITSTTGLPQVRQSPRSKFGGERYFLNEILSAPFSATSLARIATTSANGLPLNAWQIRQWHRNLAFGEVCTSNEQAPHSHAPRSGNDVSVVMCGLSLNSWGRKAGHRSIILRIASMGCLNGA